MAPGPQLQRPTVRRLPTLDDVRLGTRFFFGTQQILRQPVTMAEARAALQDRLAHRTESFLALAREAIYANPTSPYLGLLGRIDCEYGDLEHLVRSDGIEGALATLFRQGVYLTTNEAKNRAPIVRGSTTIQLGPDSLYYPGTRAGLVGRTNGSRSQRTSVPISFAAIRSHALETTINFGVRGVHPWIFASWSVPGSGSLSSLIRYQLAGLPAARWFSLVDSSAPGMDPRYAWSERVLRLAARLAGVTVPQTVHIPQADPLPIARWMADQLRAGRAPCLQTYVSPAVRLCQLAYEAGIDLTGAVFSLGGEPLTEARRATIERVGAAVSLHYGTTEAGNVGRGCLAPEAADDVHFGHDRLAVIQPGPDSAAPFPSNAVLLTSLYRHARLVLINVSLGDQAYVTQRACGCPMAELGWTTHLHSIRSYEKLTAGGMTFFDTDVMRVLDEALPARFGGSPTDYQLIDEELPDGRPGLRLLVNPRLGSLDETVIRNVFLAEIGRTSATEAVMTRVWRDAGLPIVERAAAHPTPGGKVQHVHRAQQARVAVAR